jgi:hypothetical protein
MRTFQIKPPSKRSLKQNLLVAAIIDIDLEKERRGKIEKDTLKNNKIFI